MTATPHPEGQQPDTQQLDTQQRDTQHPDTQHPDTLGIAPSLLAILACPDTHHSPLTLDAAAAELLCETCDRAFPVRDGIPVLLLDEARRRAA